MRIERRDFGCGIARARQHRSFTHIVPQGRSWLLPSFGRIVGNTETNQGCSIGAKSAYRSLTQVFATKGAHLCFRCLRESCQRSWPKSGEKWDTDIRPEARRAPQPKSRLLRRWRRSRWFRSNSHGREDAKQPAEPTPVAQSRRSWL